MKNLDTKRELIHIWKFAPYGAGVYNKLQVEKVGNIDRTSEKYIS